MKRENRQIGAKVMKERAKAQRDYAITLRESEEMDREHARQQLDQAELLLEWHDWTAPFWYSE